MNVVGPAGESKHPPGDDQLDVRVGTERERCGMFETEKVY